MPCRPGTSYGFISLQETCNPALPLTICAAANNRSISWGLASLRQPSWGWLNAPGRPLGSNCDTSLIKSKWMAWLGPTETRRASGPNHPWLRKLWLKKKKSQFLLSVLANHYSDRFREIQTTQSQYVAINLANNFTAWAWWANPTQSRKKRWGYQANN